VLPVVTRRVGHYKNEKWGGGTCRWPLADTMKSGFQHYCVGMALAVTALGAVAQNVEQMKWGAYIDLEGKVGSKRDIGEANIFIPLSQDSRTLYFANVRARLANAGDLEGSLGGGIRYMLDTGWNIGTYGFIDRRKTSYNNSYNQATIGFEALGRHVDWRFNIYQPIGKDSTTLSASHTAVVSGGALLVSTTTQEERVLPGIDIEGGWRLPLFDEEDSRQVRVYLAGYRFAGDGATVQGTRTRVEYVMSELSERLKGAQLTIGAEYQDDNARGSQHFVGLRLRIPLGNVVSSTQRATPQERRMTAPIVRDVDVVSQVLSRQLAPQVATATAAGQAITAISSDTTTGASLPGVVAAAGANSTVVLAGSFNTTASTVLQNGQTLIGKGVMAVTTADGRVVSVSLPGATINSSFAPFGAGTRATVTMTDGSTIQGMNLVSTDVAGGGVNYRGINVLGVSNARVLDNTVTLSLSNTVSGSATAIGVENSTNIIVGNNTTNSYHHDSNAAGLVVLDSSLQIYNNQWFAQGRDPSMSFALLLASNTPTSLTVLPGSIGNVILNGMCNIPLATPTNTVYMANGTTCP
jgi:hypothetical protein